jgi:hypothetical protein
MSRLIVASRNVYEGETLKRNWTWILLVAAVSALTAVWLWRGQPKASKPFVDTVRDEIDSVASPEAIVATATQETFIYWFDDIQDVSPFETKERPILPDSQACRWVLSNRDKAAEEVRIRLASHVDLGSAMMAATLGLSDMLPILVDGWLEIEEEPYNGESPTPESPSLIYFREMQGVAYAIEKLSGKPIAQTVRLSAEQRQELTKRAETDGAAAKMLLKLVHKNG